MPLKCLLYLACVLFLFACQSESPEQQLYKQLDALQHAIEKTERQTIKQLLASDFQAGAQAGQVNIDVLMSYYFHQNPNIMIFRTNEQVNIMMLGFW